jgi:7-hydroxymethyl chlorophyll a reductase
MMRPSAVLLLTALGGVSALSLSAKPITGPWPAAFPAKDLCSNCGLCKSSVGVASVTEACAFIGDGMSRAESLEASVHGRARQYDASNLDEAHFGVHENILLARGQGIQDAQWTGVATGIAVAWLSSGAVDAVVVAGSSSEAGFASPKPILCRTPSEVRPFRTIPMTVCCSCYLHLLRLTLPA